MKKPSTFKKRARPHPVQKRFKKVYDHVEMSVCDRLKSLRTERGLTQLKWADLTGFDKNYIGGFEQGRYNPSLAYIIIVSDLCKVSLDWVMGRTEVKYRDDVKYKCKPSKKLNFDKVFERVNKTIYANLRALREGKGYTQPQWSKAIGLSDDYIHTYESEKKAPSLPIQVIICDFAGASLDAIWGRV